MRDRRDPTPGTSRLVDRGVSDLVGFVLVFAVVLLIVAIVYTYGFAGLQDLRQNQQLGNAERAFDVLASNVNELAVDGVPARSTQVKVQDAALRYGQPSYLNVTVDGGGRNVTNLQVRPVVYDPSRSPDEILYVLGAVIHEQPGAGRILHRPPFVVTSDTVYLSLPKTGQASAQRVLSGTAQVRTSVSSSRSVEMAYPDTGGTYNVTVTVTAPTEGQARAWRSYLESTDATCGAVTDDAVSCSLTTQRVYVTVVPVLVEFKT